MPETISGIAITSLDGALLTEDGSHVILKYKQGDGRDGALSLPSGQISALAMLAIQSLARVQEKAGGAQLGVSGEDWETATEGKDKLLFKVKLPGGAWLPFLLPLETRQQVMRLDELLARRAALVSPSEAEH